MKLVEMKIGEYIDLLSSDAPAPGGGSASALSGVQGISLGIMVANLTLGRKKYAQFESLCKQTIDKGNLLKEKMLKLMNDDTRAYSKVIKVQLFAFDALGQGLLVLLGAKVWQKIKLPTVS